MDSDIDTQFICVTDLHFPRSTDDILIFSLLWIRYSIFIFIFFLIFKFHNYFYNNIIYGMHEFNSQRWIKTRFQMSKIRLGKTVLLDNQYPFRIEHTFHSNHTPCLSHYASNASHSCTQHNS